MKLPFRFGPEGLQILWAERDRVLHRGRRLDSNGNPTGVLVVAPSAEHPSPTVIARLAHEYQLRDELSSAWAARPLEFGHDGRRSILLLEDSGGEPLARLLQGPMELRSFLRFAIQIAVALSSVHRCCLIHKDIKPSNILVNCGDSQVRLTGFGIASRLSRERQSLEPLETIAGSLAYMAPEQTGRMNRSIDARSDLYALGVTFYQMLTGHLPFIASDPLEWVHCHVARLPIAPAERLKDVPVAVSKIVMKLLAKTAEERYQTAAGLESDLRYCFAGWEAKQRIDDFPLGENDTLDRLLILEKLYGREREVETLLASFDRVVNSGVPELVLVAGYSGIGKSSVVYELHKALAQRRALFASGKFDQYKRDVPYQTLSQSFQNLILPLLGKSEVDLAPWRDAFRDALGSNGRLMFDVVPELELIVGVQPPVSELPPKDAQRRFQLVLRRFIRVFAQPDHPLVLFLDDLQWSDAATLELLEDLLVQSDLKHIMLIGAYRDNEVTEAHPLMRKLNSIKVGRGKVTEIKLASLSLEHVKRFVAEALRGELAFAAPLAQLVSEKTGGNPYFVIQFMSSLAEEGLLIFDHYKARWSWDLDRIHAKGYTDNVADLMIGKLTRLPVETQEAMKQLAFLGDAGGTKTLASLLGASEERVHAILWPSVRQEMVERLPGTYRFVHDRIREICYSMVPEELRAETHLRIGRLVAAHTPPEQRDETMFDIVSHFNRGAALIGSLDEREQLAEFNLVAGKRAKASTAYASALTYFSSGAALLSDDCWQRRHELAFALELNRGECEFLTGALEEGERRLATLSRRTKIVTEYALVTCLRVDLYLTLGRSTRAVEVGLEYLQHLGIDLLPHPSEDEARHEYERIRSQLDGRTTEELIGLPLMSDLSSLATLDVLTRILPPALFTDINLFSLAICRAIALGLERGYSDGSCFAYVQFGILSGARFTDYQAAHRFGRLGYEMVERRGLKRFGARTYMLFGAHIMAWAGHLRAGREVVRQAFEAASRSGDITFAAYSRSFLNFNLLATGDPLVDVQHEIEQSLAFARGAQFSAAADSMIAQLGLVRTLRDLTPKFGSFDDQHFNERSVERRFAQDSNLALAECFYWILKLKARFFAADYSAAGEAVTKAQRLLWLLPLHLETAEFSFYGALSHAASHAMSAGAEQQQHLDALVAHQEQLSVWAKKCPENFESRAALVGAEIARIESRDLEAMDLYEEAIRSANANGFVHNEALANELAARFYAARGFGKIANAYLRDARYCYSRWGADGKVRQLDELYPHLRDAEPVPVMAGTIGIAVEQLELATVIKVLHAISGEIVHEKMIDRLMRTAIEQAGAERGVLVLSPGSQPRIAAEATASGDTVAVHLRDEPISAVALPESVFHNVVRTNDSVILHDAAAQSVFAEDAYIRQRQARSILCLPLINQGRLIGVLYLENNLAHQVFASDRIAVLKLLASQAAIALENTRLYRDLAEREAKIRHLVDANIIGIFIRSLAEGGDGPIVEANDAFLRMVGYDREDLLSGRISWAKLTPPEWHEGDALAMTELKKTGICHAYEKEYLRKDGSRLPVLVGAATLENGHDGVAFVLDLRDRKRAEAEARDSERRYREVQAELAHANRVATMGQLTASIAHEVNQPIGAARNNASAALRFLNKDPPDVGETREALRCAIRDMDRAGDIIGRIRDHVTKTPPRRNKFDLNDAIKNVFELVGSEVARNRISVQLELAEGLPLVDGDRVQLQQVALNLILNAVEAMSSVGDGARELLIGTEQNEAHDILVAVRDTGSGIAPENIERVFETFYTTKSSGMGMGLPICRSIVEAHGGTLWAEAMEPRGSVFKFVLPVRDADS